MSRAEQENRDDRLVASAFILAVALVHNGPRRTVLQLCREIRDYFFDCVVAMRPLSLAQRMVSAAIRLRLPSECRVYLCQRRVLQLASAENPEIKGLWGAIQTERYAQEFALLGAARNPTSMAAVRYGMRAGLDPGEVGRLFRTGQIWTDLASRKPKARHSRPGLAALISGLLMLAWLVALGLAMYFRQHVGIDDVLSFIVCGMTFSAWVGYLLFKAIKREQQLIDEVIEAYEPRIISSN